MAGSTVQRRRVDRREARALEERFIASVEGRSAAVEGVAPRPGAKAVPARRLRRRAAAFDRTDLVKQVMAERGVYDRAVLSEMPADRATVIDFRRRGLFGSRPVARVVAFCLNPIEALVADGRAEAPATLAQATERLRQVAPDPAPGGPFRYVGVFSPTGWEPSAVADLPAAETYELYLVEKGQGTQWIVHGAGSMRRLFDPETEAERAARCEAFIRERRGDTMLGGLTVEGVMAGLRVERPTAEAALRNAARTDPHLALRREGGVLRLLHTDEPRRGDLDQADQTGRSSEMGLWQSLLVWLHLKKRAPKPAEVVRELEGRRARLQVQRDDLDTRIEDLEKTGHQLGEELRAETSPTRKMGLAQKIAGVRHRVKQMHRRMSLYDKAIGVLNTHIDNLTIASEAKEFKLPSEDEMKAMAVEVDEVVEQVNEMSDLAMGLDAGAGADVVSPEIESILAEFGAAEPKAKAPAERRKAPAEVAPPAREPAAPPPAAEPSKRQPASPEAG